MLRWPFTFLVISLIAGLLGFAGGGAGGIAKMLFVLAFVIFVLSLTVGILSASSQRR